MNYEFEALQDRMKEDEIEHRAILQNLEVRSAEGYEKLMVVRK